MLHGSLRDRLAPRDITYPEQAEEDSSFCELLGWQQRQ